MFPFLHDCATFVTYPNIKRCVMENNSQPLSPTATKQALWERKLLDLSLRNPLINVRLTQSIVPLLSHHVAELEDCLADKTEFVLAPLPESVPTVAIEKKIERLLEYETGLLESIDTSLASKRLYAPLSREILDKHLTHLYRTSRSSLQENGANSLFVSLGLLCWYETLAAEEPRYAPIILVPVDLVRKPAGQGYVLRTRDEDSIINITLLEKLRQDYQIAVTGLDPLPHDEHGLDVPLIFDTIRTAIQAMPRWALCEYAFLGLFSFSKFVMWNDIHNNATQLERNLVVKSLLAQANVGITPLEEIPDPDTTYKPSDLALPVGADAYQLGAVIAAAQGKSFVLHGPPGTGKSQTITNIIANALYQGKRVLFVAEKMAALAVVQQRLANIGLDPFCLELFSHKSSKTEVLAQFQAVLDLTQVPTARDYQQEAMRLHLLRTELAEFVQAMHQPLSLGLSLYDLIARYEPLRDAGLVPLQSLKLASSIHTLTPTAFTELVALLERAEAAAMLCGNLAAHPLKALGRVEYTPALEEDLRRTLQDLLPLLPDLTPHFTSVLTELLGNDIKVTTYHQFAALVELIEVLHDDPQLFPRLFEEQYIDATIKRLQPLLARASEMIQWKETLLTDYAPQLLQEDYAKLVKCYRSTSASFFLTRILAKRKLRKKLESYHHLHVIEAESLPTLFDFLAKYHTERAALLAESSFLNGLFRNATWQEVTFDWALFQALCEKTLRVVTLLKQIAPEENDWTIRRRFLRHLTDLLKSSEATIKGWQDFLIAARPVRDLLKKINDLVPNTVQLPNLPYPEALATVYHPLHDNLHLLRDWFNWSVCAAELEARDWKDLLTHLYEERMEVANCKDVTLITLYAHLIRTLVSDSPRLARFNSTLFEEEVARFRTLSEQFQQLTQQELVARLAANLLEIQKDPEVASELGFLQRKLRSNGRGTPLRKFFEGIPTLLHRLKPCMLMSPISVAQYIDLSNEPFDLVVFDEASQLPTGEAVGAMARAKSVIVVGDPKQMPPTSFFATSKEDEENLEYEDLESILDDTLAIPLPSRHLRGHYRSKHESLIAFSNTHFYDRQLLTFPSPDNRQSQVSIHYVDGVYDRSRSRTNKQEAQAVVEAVIQHLADPARSVRSLGIVTFSIPQQTLIEDLLTEALAAHPDLETRDAQSPEPIFVKNLENVQGDERDEIFFSIGYGPDAEGNLSHNFGPLNQKGGWRRLNVAITRARYAMHVYTTIHYEQIDLKRTSAEGVAALRDFLEFAEKGTLRPEATTITDPYTTPDLVDQIAETLRTKGYCVDTHVGTSEFTVDLAIVDPTQPSRYLLGILCDGRNYQAAPTVADRELTRPRALLALGWRLFRLWSLDWFYRRDETLARIETALRP